MLTVETTSMPGRAAAPRRPASAWRCGSRARWCGRVRRPGRRRGAGEHRVHVHLGEDGAPVLQLPARDLLQAVQHHLGARPAVVLDEADHAVRAPLDPAVRLGQHRVGLADARRRAEVDPELAASHAPYFPPFAQVPERDVQLQDVDARLAEEAEGAAVGVVLDQPRDLGARAGRSPGPRGSPGGRRTPGRCPGRGRSRRR